MSKKKFSAVLTALVMALTMALAGTASATTVVNVSTSADLMAIATAVNNGTDDYSGKTVILLNDIDLSSIANWTPIGYFESYYPWATNRPFKGVFDGAGHSITGLTVSNPSNGETAALFGYIKFSTAAATSRSAKTSTISPAAKAAADAATFGITGEAYDKVVQERTAFYSKFGIAPAAISTRSVTPTPTGGIVKNVKVYGSVSNSAGQGAAGVVCWNDGLIENYYFEGTISCSPNNRAYAGGICSLLGGNTYVVNCAAKGSISATGTAYSYAGGIAGYCYAMDTGYVVNCSVEPTSVVFSHMDTGGVVGGFANQVYNCVSAAASVTVDGHNPNEAGYFTGGIVGAFGTAYNCYWLQTTGSTTQPGHSVGGGSDASGLRTTVAALPTGSILFAPMTLRVNETRTVASTAYPTGATATAPSLSGWNSTDTSVATVSSYGAVTGYSTGTATISATATSAAWISAPAGSSVTPECFVTITQ